jgi:hypothetical protein
MIFAIILFVTFSIISAGRFIIMEKDIFAEKNNENMCSNEHLLKYLSKRMPRYAWLKMAAFSGKHSGMFQECHMEED